MSDTGARTRWSRSFLEDTRAMAAAEMALVLPIIAFITLNVVDLASYLYSRMQVDLAAQQAAGIVRKKCIDNPVSVCSTTYNTDMTTAMQTTRLGNLVTLNGTISEQYYCANTSGALVAMPTPVASTCASVVSGSTAKPGSYLTVPVKYTYAAAFPKLSIASLLTKSITSTAVIRVQ